MIILRLFFFIILAVIITVVMGVVRILWSVRKMRNELRKGAEEMGRQTSSRSSSGRTSSGHSTSTGDTITDTRDPQRASRKIIDDDEGEYVDFEEER
jgi:heme exporter protein D